MQHTMIRLWVPAVAILLILSVPADGWLTMSRGECSACLWSAAEKTALQGTSMTRCVNITTTAFRGGTSRSRLAGRDYNDLNFAQNQVCLTTPSDPEAKPPASVLTKMFNVGEGRYDFYEKIAFTNMWSMKSVVTVRYNKGSSFAIVEWNKPLTVEQRDPHIGYVSPAEATWFNVSIGQRDSTIVFVSSVTKHVYRPQCYTERWGVVDFCGVWYQWISLSCDQEWPGCVPRQWGDCITQQTPETCRWIDAKNRPSEEPFQQYPRLVPVQPWCVGPSLHYDKGFTTCTNGLGASTDLTCNNLGRINESVPVWPGQEAPPKDHPYWGRDDSAFGEIPRQNMCIRDGYCKCSRFFGGANCSVYLGNNELLRDIRMLQVPTNWLYPGEEPSLSRSDWSGWRCAQYDPCSGAGTCIDPPAGKTNQAPTCRCYDGFFGNSTADLEAYGNTFFCSAESGGAWNDLPATNEVWPPRDDLDPPRPIDQMNRPVTKYMMMHQCMLWRGRDSTSLKPLNWKTENPRFDYRPSVPYECAPGFAGPGCRPKIACVEKVEQQDGKVVWHGSVVTLSPTSLESVCKCTENWVGADCSIQKCPLNETAHSTTDSPPKQIPDGSPCGSAASHGRCVLPAGATYTPYSPITASPFVCECDNGYAGLGCGIRLCNATAEDAQTTDNPRGWYTKSMMDEQVCGGSSLTLFPEVVIIPRGWCNVSANGMNSSCVCLPGYTGTQCQRRSCPSANGLPCNGLVFSDGQSVCINNQPDVLPFCACSYGGKTRTPDVFDKWYGSACEFPYHAPGVCVSPDDWAMYGANTTRWCSSGSTVTDKLTFEKMCRPPPDAGLNGRPRCDCLRVVGEGSATQFIQSQFGEFCQYSICGNRFANGRNVEASAVCSGYSPLVVSGVCFRYEFGETTSVVPTNPISLAQDTTNFQPRNQFVLGKCKCQAIGRLMPSEAPWMTFVGTFCQYAVPNCTNPMDGSGNVCSNKESEIRGDCQVDDKTHFCKCRPGYMGAYCEKAILQCSPECTPGAGICQGSEGIHACTCRNPNTIYTGPITPWSSLACNTDTCNMTGGVTNLWGGDCICPPGRTLSIVPCSAGVPECVDRWDHSRANLAGCRRLCPMSAVLPGYPVECGGLNTIEKRSLCSTAQQGIATLSDMLQTPVCNCQGPPGKPFLGVDMFAQLFVPGNPKQNMGYTYNSTTRVCDPVCGHGSVYSPTTSAPFFSCSCPSDQSADSQRRYQECRAYDSRTNYKELYCKNGGTMPAKKCVCTWAWTGDQCEVSRCAPKGRYSLDYLHGEACQCTYPYRLDTDQYSPTYRRCIDNCTNGFVVAQPNYLPYCQCNPGWQDSRNGTTFGGYCDQNFCQPYGSICPNATVGVPCCCSTYVVRGYTCSESNCAISGQFITPINQPPICRCGTNSAGRPLFAGTRCEYDLCAQPAQAGGTTGYAERVSGSTDWRCVCTPGYALGEQGFCTTSLCGSGTVRLTTGDSYRCECSGPDTKDDPLNDKGICRSVNCMNGGTKDGRGKCVCPPGFELDDCSRNVCGTSGHLVFVDGRCVCRYPFVNEAKGCVNTTCGSGSQGAIISSFAGNPLEYQCACDVARGYSLNRTDTGPQAPCVLQCNPETTLAITLQGCICKTGFGGPFCQEVFASCPIPPDPGLATSAIWVQYMVPTLIVAILLLVAVGIGVWQYMLRHQRQPNPPDKRAEAGALLADPRLRHRLV